MTQIILAVIFALVILESIALFNGINGTLLTSVFTILGGLAGYRIKHMQK